MKAPPGLSDMIRILHYVIKKAARPVAGLFFVAEGAGFEPAWGCPLTVFKTAPL